MVLGEWKGGLVVEMRLWKVLWVRIEDWRSASHLHVYLWVAAFCLL